MKLIYQTLLTLCCVSLIIAAACKKHNNNVSTISPPINQLFSDLRSTPQNFTVTAGKNQTIIGTDSTVVNFYPNSFKDKNGNIITSGTVSIQLLEMYKPGDMIANRTSATANGQLIQSGGQIKILATMNGQEVFANKYGLAFKQPGFLSKRMELYYGGVTGSDSVTTWSITDTTKNGTKSYCVIKNDTTNNGKDTSRHYDNWPNIYYLFDSCTTFNWINCDHFFGDSTINSSITINFPDNSYTIYNTQIFIVFPKINSSQTFYGTYNSANTSITNSSVRLPKGQNIEIAVIANKNGTFYYFAQTGIATANTISITAAMATETRGDIIARLLGL